jgi:ABC-type amino acid transport substrate-binding protein
MNHKKNPRKIISYISVLLLFLAWIASSATAENLRLATLATAPYGFIEQDKTVGLIYDMLNLIAETAEFSYTNQLMPLARIIADLESGEIDATICIPHEAVKKVGVLIMPMPRIETIVIGLKGTSFPTLVSLHGKTVGIIRTASYDAAFIKDPAIIKYEVNSYEQNVNMLIAGRLDAIAGVKTAIYYLATQLKCSPEMFGEPLILNTNEAWLLISKQTATKSLIARLKHAVERLNQKKKLQGIDDKYLAAFQNRK